MKKPSNEQLNAMFKTIDALLGPVEEWSAQDLDEVLAEAGVDVEQQMANNNALNFAALEKTTFDELAQVVLGLETADAILRACCGRQETPNGSESVGGLDHGAPAPPSRRAP